MDFNIEKINYSVPVSDEVWDALNDTKRRFWDSTIIFEELNKRFEKYNAFDLEYNGHFGQNIYFTTDSRWECDLKIIEKIINSIPNFVENILIDDMKENPENYED